ncbi:MAG: hypothetical protein P1U89_24375 [Verrucomicrobiales bacterium]|nr:hypothetical protein [Verrucomicrobiales bacterium]
MKILTHLFCLCFCGVTFAEDAVGTDEISDRVQLRDGKIIFRGIDISTIVAQRESDIFEESKYGLMNITKEDRCVAEAMIILDKLRKLVTNADTLTLIKSLRQGEPGGSIDYYVSREGNWIIAKELSKRRPIPPHLKPDGPVDYFLGWSGPSGASRNFDGLLESASRELKRGNKQGVDR